MSVDVSQTHHAWSASTMHSADAARPLRACRVNAEPHVRASVLPWRSSKAPRMANAEVELPYWLVSASWWWQFGRRVWMSIRPPGHFTPKPSGPRGEKRWSQRLRASLTLARRTTSSRMPCGQSSATGTRTAAAVPRNSSSRHLARRVADERPVVSREISMHFAVCVRLHHDASPAMKSDFSAAPRTG